MLPKLHRRHEDDSHYPVCKMSPGIPPGLFHFRVRSTAVVRSAVNRMVEGSNPSCPAKFAGLVQWQNGSLVSCASEVRFLCPAPEPTTWDPSAREPTLPYPHLPGLSPGFLFRPQTINSRCPVAIVSDGLSLTTTQHPEAGGVECNV